MENVLETLIFFNIFEKFLIYLIHKHSFKKKEVESGSFVSSWQYAVSFLVRNKAILTHNRVVYFLAFPSINNPFARKV